MTAMPADDPLDVDGLLDTMASYADEEAAREQDRHKRSLAVALAVQELYESRVWVDEWLVIKPPPKRPNNRWKADSINRFQQWQAWRNEQRHRHGLPSRTTYRMVNVATVASVIPNLPYGKLGSAQPFAAIDWLRKNKHLEGVPAVWRIAVEMAGSADRVTQEHTKAALAQWKHEHFPGAAGSRVARNAGMEAQRLKAQGAFDELLYRATRSENGREELQKYLDHVKAQLAERRK